MFTCSRLLAVSAAVAWIVAGSSAHAACTKLASSVNDYGKDGPTTDAKAQLDKYIVKWAKEHGVTKYSTGKKTVTCELYLDVGVFDEYTCRAMATVCWEAPKAAPAATSGEKK